MSVLILPTAIISMQVDRWLSKCGCAEEVMQQANHCVGAIASCTGFIDQVIDLSKLYETLCLCYSFTYLSWCPLTAAKKPTFSECKKIHRPWLQWVNRIMYLNAQNTCAVLLEFLTVHNRK